MKINARVSSESINHCLELSAFLSTPKFIKCLTDVSLTLSLAKTMTKEEKLAALKEQMHKIN
jgi:hypothetical protein